LLHQQFLIRSTFAHDHRCLRHQDAMSNAAKTRWVRARYTNLKHQHNKHHQRELPGLSFERRTQNFARRLHFPAEINSAK
jgi:hypothetical protein